MVYYFDNKEADYAMSIIIDGIFGFLCLIVATIITLEGIHQLSLKVKQIKANKFKSNIHKIFEYNQ